MMRRIAFLVALCLVVAGTAAGDNQSGRILVLDNCDPTDPRWGDIGGCTLRRGDVTREEFDAFVFVPGGGQRVQQGGGYGHPSWRNDPEYTRVRTGRRIRVINNGGRRHTFTEVPAFQPGFIAGLNNPPGLPPGPQCNPATVQGDLPPGETLTLHAGDPGLHIFQCCIHPWMRTAIRVTEGDDEDED